MSNLNEQRLVLNKDEALLVVPPWFGWPTVRGGPALMSAVTGASGEASAQYALGPLDSQVTSTAVRRGGLSISGPKA